MAVQNLSQDIILVVLPAEPQTSDKLKTVNEMVSQRCDFDMIVDFSRIEILISTSISNLLTLHNWLDGSGHRLILCNVSFPTKCVFKTAGLDTFFDFADDKFAALEILQTDK